MANKPISNSGNIFKNIKLKVNDSNLFTNEVEKTNMWDILKGKLTSKKDKSIEEQISIFQEETKSVELFVSKNTGQNLDFKT